MLRGDPTLNGEPVADRLGSGLSRLLVPLDVTTFLSDAWEQKALRIPGSAGKFDHLDFDTEALLDILEADPKRVVRAVYSDRAGDPGDLNILADQAPSLFDAGLTIGVVSLEEAHPPFRELADTAKAFLNLSGSVVVVAYWSPGSGGVGTHFDAESVLILQLEGAKRWRYSPTPGLVSPRRPFMAALDDNRLL
ncbi:MAG: JmjC domain-containing protein, partial [Acidimicrobiia bacterium]